MNSIDPSSSNEIFSKIKPEETAVKSGFKRWISEKMYSFSRFFDYLYGYDKGAAGRTERQGVLTPLTVHVVPRKPRPERHIES